MLPCLLLSLAFASGASATSIVYTKSPDGYSGLELWRSDADGSNRVRLSTGGTTGIEHPVLSPDGKQVAFTSADGGLFTINIDGTGKRNVVPRPDGQTWWERPSWSPDATKLYVGKHIQKLNSSGSAYVDSWSIYRVNADGSGLTQIVSWPAASGRPDQHDPMISHDGTKLAFASTTTPSGGTTNGSTIWTTNADGSNPQQITPTPTTWDVLNTDQTPHYNNSLMPAFSPSDGEITFTREVYSPQLTALQYDLAGVPASGGTPFAVTSTGDRDENNASWSPGGTIVYQRHDWSGHTEVWTNTAGADSPLLAESGTAYDQPSYGTSAAILDGTASTTQRNALLQRYTPQLRMDSQELYFADAASMATDNFVNTGNKKTSYTNSLIAADNTTLATASATGTTKLSLSYLPSVFSHLAYPGWPTRFPQSGDHIQLNNSTLQTDAQRMDALTQYKNHIYGHAVFDGGHWWLQYWMYYYYNPVGNIASIGNHQSDWEMVQIRLDSNALPDQTTYAQHDGAESCNWSDVGKTTSPSGDQIPVVYPANASHASYYAAGSTATNASYGFSTDDHRGDGRNVIPALDVVDTNTPNWLGWPGKWGGSGSSPTGPQQHSQWINAQSFHDGAASCLLPLSSARAGHRGGHATDRGTIDPSRLQHAPAPSISAHRHGRSVRVAFSFGGRLPAGRRHPRSVLLTVHAANPRLGPTGGFYRVRGRSGVADIPLPKGGGGPYTVRASAYGKRGVRSRVIKVRGV